MYNLLVVLINYGKCVPYLLVKRPGVYFISKSVKGRLNEEGVYSRRAFIEHPVSGSEEAGHASFIVINNHMNT